MKVTNTYADPTATEEERLERNRKRLMPVMARIYNDPVMREKIVFSLIQDEEGNLCFENGLGERRPVLEYQRKAVNKWLSENEETWRSRYPDNAKLRA